MRITAIADTTDIRARLRQYATLLHKDVSDSVRRFAVVACRNLANTTQPFSGRDKETKATARALGEKAVEVDISKVFYVPTPDGGFVQQLHEQAHKSHTYKRNKTKDKKFDADRATLRFTDRLNGYVASGNIKALQKITKDFGWKNARRTIDPAIHEARRTGRRSKVRKQPGDMTLILNTEKHLQSYIKKRQKMVGLTKAGWAKAADMIPTSNKGSATRGIPQWVTRNKGKASASIQDLSRDERNPRVTMSNRIPWTSNNMSPNEARKALELAKANWVEYLNKSMRGELRRQAKLAAI
jgi:hypothetical protein